MAMDMGKLNNLFAGHKKYMPRLGALKSEREFTEKKLNNWTYIFISSVLSFFLSLRYGLLSETQSQHLILQTFWFVLSIFMVCVTFVFCKQAIEAKELTDECKDLDLLKKVAASASEHHVVEQQLQQCLSASDRDYLCWYEVFSLIDTASKAEQSKALEAVKKQLGAIQRDK